GDALVIAVVAAVVSVATLIVDSAVSILIAEAERLFIAVFIDIIFVADLEVARVAAAVVVVAIVPQGVFVFVEAGRVGVTVVVLVRWLVDAAVFRVAAGVLGAIYPVVAVRRVCGREATVSIRIVVSRATSLAPVAKLVVVA